MNQGKARGTVPVSRGVGRRAHADVLVSLGKPRAAFTLLELMLALALTAVVLIAVNMAVNLHLRLFASRRSFLEESQLAREVLRLISDDIRSAVVPYEQDVSCVAQMLGTASSSGSNAGGDSSSAASDSQPSESGSQGSSSTSQAGGDSSRGSSQPQSSSQQGSSSQPETGAETGDTAAQTEDTAEMLGETDTSTNTEDLSTAVTLPTKPGIYGNQYELQVDISRLPREDEFITSVETNPTTSIIDIPSDVKTVTYYVLNNETSFVGTQPELTVTDLSQATDPTVVGHGLVRRQLDRCVTEWALNNGNATVLANEGEVIAPEAISVEFLYFDGLEWRTEWDSESEGGIPVAIQILLAFGDLSEVTARTTPSTSISATGLENVRYYRTVVYLPTAAAQDEQPTSDTESLGL